MKKETEELVEIDEVVEWTSVSENGLIGQAEDVQPQEIAMP